MEFITKSGVHFNHDGEFKGYLDIRTGGHQAFEITILMDDIWEFYSHIINTFKNQSMEAQKKPREFTIYDAKARIDNCLHGYSWYRGSVIMFNGLIVYGSFDFNRVKSVVPEYIDIFPVKYSMVEN